MYVNAIQLFSNIIFLLIKVVCGLKTKPKPCFVVEVPFEPECCVWGDASFSLDDLIDSSRGNIDIFGEAVLADVERLKKIFFEEDARVFYCNAFVSGHGVFLLVVVTEFDVVGLAVFPAETDAPLLVDSDAVLTGSVTSELFKLVTRWCFKVVKFFSQINLNKPLSGSYSNLVSNGFNVLAVKYAFSGLVCESFYHGFNDNAWRY